jgi:hypothetical protein
MRNWIALIAAAVALLGVEDPWAKVRDLKAGAELRILKRGTPKPVMATFDQLTDEKLVVATKTEQIAISRDEIERIDYRPASGGKGVKVESSTKSKDDPGAAARPQPYGNRSGQSIESNTTIGSGKPDFETIYRRTVTLPAPKK